MSIGKRVRARRQDLHLSQEAIARRAGVSLNLVNRVEREQITDPHVSTLRSLARGLGVRVEDLVEDVITFPPGAVEEVLETYKEGKISKKEASRAIRDLAHGSTEDALERIQEEGAAERSRNQEEQEA